MCLKSKPRKPRKPGKFECKKCGAVAGKKKKICKPTKID
jgi:hypothetical protein